LHVIYIHAGVIAEAILVHQELDTHGLPSKGRHVDRLEEPSVAGVTQVEDGLQDSAVCVGDIGILPVKANRIGTEVQMPEV
jgi:hypothetical protein